MSAPEEYDQDRPVTEDLIQWQTEAQTAPTPQLTGMIQNELMQLADVLDQMNELLCDEENYTADTAAAVLTEVMRLSMMASIHVLGMIERRPGGVAFALVPLSAN